MTPATGEMREIDRVHLEMVIHPVRLGAKPASSTSASGEDLAEVLDIIKKRGLLASAKKVHGRDSYDIHVYLKPHMSTVIENAPAFEDPVVEAWYWGKVYGYSEEAIASFVVLEPDAVEKDVLAGRAGEQGHGVVAQCHGMATPSAHVGPRPGLLTRCWHLLHLLSEALETTLARATDSNRLDGDMR